MIIAAEVAHEAKVREIIKNIIRVFADMRRRQSPAQSLRGLRTVRFIA